MPKKRSAADKQVIKDEAEATVREEKREKEKPNGYFVNVGGREGQTFVRTGPDKEK